MSYQGDPGTGVEATGLLPFAAVSSPLTSMGGGSFEGKRRREMIVLVPNTLSVPVTKWKITKPRQAQLSPAMTTE